jgi:acyl transferase domain-containing protein/NAD(P)-dependent dehydrogenase (short-subunit alcohol dehydrogenase family)
MSEDKERQVPLAIIGMGCLFPKADGAKRYWANIKNKVDAISEVPASHWSSEDYFDKDPKRPDFTYARRGGFLDPVDFDPAEFGITPAALEATDSAQLLGLVAAGLALRDAGYGPERDFDRKRVSVILGVTGTLELVVPLGARLGHPIWRKALKEHGIEGEAAESIIERIKDGYVPWQENSFPGLLGNVVAGRIANRYNLGGTNCVVDAACASSLSAAHLASLELGARRSSMVVTGGVDCFNDIFMYMCFSKTPALSPTGDIKPFDKKADGTIIGEGLGMVVLKRLDDAERDGDRIYAVLKGVGSSSDGRGKAIYAPSAEGQTKALRQAYEVSGITPDTVELVEAHGTGTTVGDGAELEALSQVYREAGSKGTWCALGSVKSMIGHTKAAAGSAGMIKAALSLYHKVLPPTIKVSEPLAPLTKDETPFYLNTEKRPWLSSGHPRRAAVSALGFGGSNFHVVLEEYQPKKTAVDWDGDVQIAAFSGRDTGDIKKALSEWSEGLSWDEVRVKAMESRATFKASDEFRLCFVIEKGKTNLAKTLESAASALNTAPSTASTVADNVYVGKGAAAGVAVLFSGQGSQYVGMGRDLACQFPQAQEALQEADAAFDATPRLGDLIHPHPAFEPGRKEEQEKALRATDVAQPALGAVGLGLYRVLEWFGLKPSALGGHSYGELAALCAGGRLSSADLHGLSRLRGKLMAGDGGDRGGMFAVQAALAEIERAILEEKLDLVIANKNAPLQAVLSGRTSEIERACEALSRRGLRGVRLPVAAAFHSPLVAAAAKPFRDALDKIELKGAVIPVYANKTAQIYPDKPEAVRDLLASQLASPVEFVSMVERMHADGARVFLEVGPGNRLAGLVSKILAGKSHAALAVDASSGRRSGSADLAGVLAQLAALGQPVRLELWEDGEEGVRSLTGRKKGKMSVKLSGANYRSTKPSTKAPVKVQPAPAASPRPEKGLVGAPAPASGFLSESLRAAQESLNTLQKMQEQTALLHTRFLEGQEAAQRHFQALVEQQQQLFASILSGAPVLIPAASVTVPPPAIVPAARPVQSPAINIEKVLLAVVSEKTGYPAETLNADMDLESDLGIDSIKRVEILSAIQEKLPGAPRVKPEHLGTLRTLKQIVAFLSEGMSTSEAQPPTRRVDAPSVTPSVNNIEQVLLAVVSEKTGYPAETLNADMDLESDLGIDSIKRVEILSAIQEKLPGAPKIKPEHLGTLRTLKQIVSFLSEGFGTSAALPPTGRVDAPSVSAPVENIEQILLTVVSEKTGYPAETLNADMDLESDLGIDSIKRVEILSAIQEKLPGAPRVKPEHLGTLRTLKQIVAFLSAGTAATSASPRPAEALVEGEARPASSAGSVELVRSVLRAIDLDDGMLRETVKISTEAPLWVVDDGSSLGRAVVQRLNSKGLKAQLIEINEGSIPAALAGLIILAPASRLSPKALWTEDSERFLKQAFALTRRAGAALEKTGRSGGAVFMTLSRLDGIFGLSGLKQEQDPLSGALAGLVKTAGHEWKSVSCKAADAPADRSDLESLADEIVEEAALNGPSEVGLASTGRKRLELEESPLERRAKAPFDEGDVVLVTGGARGVTAETAVALAQSCRPTLVLWGRTPWPEPEPEWMKACEGERELKKALAAREPGLAPKVIGERCRSALAGREVRRQVARMEAAGSKTIYMPVDARDSVAVACAIKRIATEHGPVRGLIHGAGVLADKLILEKTAEQFDAVFETKVAGLRRMLEALDLAQLKALALFSSTTGRFGRTGQCDYAMANEALNKSAQMMARRWPNCRVVSFGWGPWDGGMVTESLKKVFDSEGVAVIGLEAGARFLCDELGSGSQACELVVLARKQPKAAARAELRPVFERVLSVEDHPFLLSHVINGKAVLPTAVIAELFAHAALHGNPGLVFHGWDGLRILKGILLEAEPYGVCVYAGKARRRDGLFVVPVELRGLGAALHAAAEIVLAAKLPQAPAASPAPKLDAYALAPERAYRDILFHGPDMRFIRSVVGCSSEGIAVETSAALPPQTWMRRPWRDHWISDPAALDAAFQAMILWTSARQGAGCLPSHAASFRQYAAFPENGALIRVRARERAEGLASADAEFIDAEGRLVARLENLECTVDKSLNEAFRRNTLASAKLSGGTR